MFKIEHPDDEPYIIAREEGDIIYVYMGGAINAATLPKTRAMVDEIIKSHKIYERFNLKILVDYENVTGVDSSTIANILERIQEHKKHYHTVAFVNPPRALRKLIEIHKLEDKITIYDSRKKAIRELEKPTQ